MKKILLILLLGLLLAACNDADLEQAAPEANDPVPTNTVQIEPTIEPTITPDPDLVTSSEELVGVWQGSIAGENGHFLYRADGSYQMSLILNQLLEKPKVTGEYWFEDNYLHIRDLKNVGHWAECDAVGIYRVRRQDNGSLRFEPVEEACQEGGFTRHYVYSNMVQIWLGEPDSLESAAPEPEIEVEEEAEAETSNHADLAAGLQELLEQYGANENSGAVLLVDIPDLAFHWKGATGMADPASELAMVPDEQFIISSVTKMYTAASIMLLAEQDLLSLDDLASQHIAPERIAALARQEDSAITVRQLLAHTSGLEDFSNGPDSDESGLPDFKDLVLAEPDTIWEPEMVLDWAAENTEPVAQPGEMFHYSDTNYQLLGLIIENVSGMTLPETYRKLIFEPLGMEHTYFEFKEPVVLGTEARIVSHPLYFGNDWTEFDSHSYEFASGGLVSTVEDQNRFLWAWATGDLFAATTSKELMMDWGETSEPGYYYGLGTTLFVLEEWGIPELGTLQGHGGLFNSLAFYWPEMNATMVATLNNNEPPFGFIGLMIDVMTLVKTEIAE